MGRPAAVIPNGTKFGRLIVIEEVARDRHNHRRFSCECSCGNELVVVSSNLQSGTTQSCGCYMADRASAANTTHGLSKNHLFGVWYGMHRRCYNEKFKAYPDYGGRGIRVCRSWHDFYAFERWNDELPSDQQYRDGLHDRPQEQ